LNTAQRGGGIAGKYFGSCRADLGSLRGEALGIALGAAERDDAGERTALLRGLSASIANAWPVNGGRIGVRGIAEHHLHQDDAPSWVTRLLLKTSQPQTGVDHGMRTASRIFVRAKID